MNNNIPKYISILIPGEPRGKGRPRFRSAGKFVQTYPAKEDTNYENLVRTIYTQRYGCELTFDKNIPICVNIEIYYQIPKSTSNKKSALMLSRKIYPTKKPDCDNVEKIIMDALNKVAFFDDSQVVELHTKKYFSNSPCVAVMITEVEHDGTI